MPPSLGAPPQGAEFRLGLSLRKVPFLFLGMAIRVFPTHVIPAPSHVIPALTYVIPALLPSFPRVETFEQLGGVVVLGMLCT